MLTLLKDMHPHTDDIPCFAEFRAVCPEFDALLTEAGLVPVEGGRQPSLVCEQTGYQFFMHHRKRLLQAYKTHREAVLAENPEAKLEDWFDLKSGEPLAVAEGDMTFKSWMLDNGGIVSLGGIAILILDMLGDFINLEAFLDYGGAEDWYLVCIRRPGDPGFQRYYL